MEFLDYMKRRESVREFTGEPVSHQDLLYCLEAARLSPSSLNSQPWKFIVVDDPLLHQKVCAAIHDPLLQINRFVYGSAAIVVVLKDTSSMNLRIRTLVKKFNFTPYDIGIAVQSFCLAAVDRGLGTCIIGWGKHRRIKDLLFIPDDKEIALMIAIGHPKEEIQPKAKNRKPLESIYSFNTYR